MLVSARRNNPQSLTKFCKAILLYGLDNIEISHQPTQSLGTCTYKRMGTLKTYNCKDLIAVFDGGTVFLYGHNQSTAGDLLNLINYYLKE